jgi:hypothetical protein
MVIKQWSYFFGNSWTGVPIEVCFTFYPVPRGESFGCSPPCRFFYFN